MIIHVDMDAFYASIEEHDNPDLVGLPVIVGGNPNRRGVVSAANYIARQYGVHSAMPSSVARRKCPDGIFLPVRMSRYVEVSQAIHKIFQRYTPLIEPLSLDEAFLDITGSISLFGPPSQIGRRIKSDILHELSLIASVGIAPNMFLAKIASDLQKPDGFVEISLDKIQKFLDPLSVSKIWGVGRVCEKQLQLLHIRTIAQLRRTPLKILESQLGSTGQHLWRLARGIDDRHVVPEHQAKSISHETTFDVDISNRDLLRSWVIGLTEQVARRLRTKKLRAHTAGLRVRFSDFRTITRSQKLSTPTDITEEILSAVKQIFDNRLPNSLPPVRLIGMSVGNLVLPNQHQRSLFEERQRKQQSQLDHVTDQIQTQFGQSSIHRASLMNTKKSKPKKDRS